MDETRVIEVKREILANNDAAADAFRAALKAEGTLFTDVMASPGAGKTTLLLALIAQLRADAEAAGEPEHDGGHGGPQYVLPAPQRVRAGAVAVSYTHQMCIRDRRYSRGGTGRNCGR